MFKYHYQFKVLKKIINSKSFGIIKTINIKFGIPHLNNNNFRYRKNNGGGAFFDLGCYTIKLNNLILKQKPKTIYGKIFKKKSKVDLSGFVVLSYKNDITSFLEWSFGRSYLNILEIWTDKLFLKLSKPFSKKADEITKMEIYTNNRIKYISIKPDNHFKKMFEYYYFLINSNNKKNIYKKELINHQNIYFKILENIS